MRFSDLLTIIPFYLNSSDVNKFNNLYFNKLEIDHRNIEDGDVFICLQGFTVDGHQFAQQAEENGAIAIISEYPVDVSIPTLIVTNTNEILAKVAAYYYNFPSHELSLFGITGTNGKTTISYLLEAIFQQYEKKTGIIGTIQTKIGKQTFPVTNTTPNALTLQKTLSHMTQANVEAVFMEVSSHALKLGRSHGCDYDVAIFTNLSQDHLDFHDTMDDYLQAKSLLFSQLGNTYHRANQKFAIINEDDPASDFIKTSTAQHILTYGCYNKADVMALNINTSIFQTNFTMSTPSGSIEINSPLIGKFNIYNMLAAATAAIAKNIPLQVIQKAFKQIEGISGRFEKVRNSEDFAVIVDYAHTPDSLENVLQTIQTFAEGQIYVVVGCGGDRDRSKRPQMANIALKYADKAIFTSDNPRTEDPHLILQDMIKGTKKLHYEVIVDRKEAIDRAIELAMPKDIVLIAGKGHETFQQIDRIKYEFDDRKIAEEAIRMKEK